MNEDLLRKILASPSLPTLPAAALEVVDLCRRDDTPMDQLARAICKDPAIATKVLRTVNSVHFGLRSEVTTISHALVLLGLQTVKSIALGFTLVGSLQDAKGRAFDPSPLWRRSLVSAVGARSIALKTGGANPEEAFLGGLLQDMGILALIQTLGTPYIDLLNKGGECHQNLAVLEREYLKLDHAEVGEALARHWNLPAVLAAPIRYHERPDCAADTCKRISYAVALGNKAALPFFSKDAKGPLQDYLTSATEWLNLDRPAAKRILEATAQAAPQMSNLFQLPEGQGPNLETIMKDAREIMLLLEEGGSKDRAA